MSSATSTPADLLPALAPELCPPAVIGAGALGKLVFNGADPAVLLARLRARGQPQAPAALLDQGLLHLYAGQRELALAAQRQALARQPLYRVTGPQPVAAPPRLRLLALCAPGDLMMNTPLEFILTGSDVSLDLLYLQPGVPLPTAVPDHDLAFVGVCQSEENDPVLRRLIPLVRSWPRPVVNDPQRLLALSRESVAERLAGAPGICIPPTRRFARAEVEAWAAGSPPPAFPPPFIIRPLGSHAGKGLARIAHLSELPAFLLSTPSAEYYAAPYLDYRGPDGQFRKYRIVFIDRQPFLCHLAIARDWMVHYVGADMATVAANRAEEERAMADFDRDFVHRHAAAFAALHRAFGLDYFGLDCAEASDGRLLIFEVASAMVIHAMDSEAMYPYKQVQMRKTFAAFHRMLDRVAAQGARPQGPAWH